MTQSLPNINEVKSELCRREGGFLYFIYYIQQNYNGYKPHLYDYQKEIVQFLVDVMAGKITKGIINLPPRYRKTEIVVKLWISYCLAMNPKARFIHLSYSDDLALDNSEAIRDIILSDCFQELFPIKLKRDSKSKKKWYTEDGGGVYATSAAGQVTGFGAGKSIEDYGVQEEIVDDDEQTIKDMEGFFNKEFAVGKFGGAIVMDDANKPDDAWSQLLLSRINNRFDSTIKNRVNSRYTPIINNQQRIAPNDLSGYLLESDSGWQLLKLSALKEDGTALCDKIHTVKELQRLKAENENVFNCQYQQEPKVAEGLMYNLQKVDTMELKGVSISAIDPADDGNCFLGGAFAYIHSNRVWVHDIIYTKENSDITIPIVGAKAKKHKCYAVHIEKDGLGGIYSKQVKKIYPLVQQFNAKGNKDARIFDKAYIISKFFRFYKISPDKDYENAIKSLDGYEKIASNNPYKDIQDALTSLAVIAIKNNLLNIYE